ncbi:MAG TPA: ATP-binding protein, partial [Mariprofundaceae bacterium]|nr:ATP-binding protein [Mariprofundaceae bacterium]
AEAQEHARRHILAETVARIALEMAHEVKNPLASLRGAAQWLSEQPVEGDIRETTVHILGEVDRIRDRIDAFLQVGPRAAIKMVPTNLHALIHDVEHPVPEIQVKHVFDPSLPEILTHPARLRQALENLWNNAVDAAATHIEWQTRMAPTVRLPDHKGAVVEVRITNDGAPIPEELRERLFEPYVTGKKRGSGLGLALVERVMLEHGGRVSMISERGRTTFVLHLPVRNDESTMRSE